MLLAATELERQRPLRTDENPDGFKRAGENPGGGVGPYAQSRAISRMSAAATRLMRSALAIGFGVVRFIAVRDAIAHMEHTVAFDGSDQLERARLGRQIVE